MTKTAINLVVILTIVLLLIFLTNKGGSSKVVSQLSKDSSTVIGEVIDVDYIHRHGYKITYKYVWNYQEYIASNIRGKYSEIKNRIFGKHFPVILSRSIPEISYMLVLKDEYLMFGRNYPDSMRIMIER